MLTPSRRPRAPSAAALRVLYQLAYISSGTVVAGGLLCLEEQRRRIQIVKKIADNAKRLRAHPRYNSHGITTASTPSIKDDFDLLPHYEEEPRHGTNAAAAFYRPVAADDANSTRHNSSETSTRSSPGRTRHTGGAPTSAFLPSVVARDYEQINTRQSLQSKHYDLQGGNGNVELQVKSGSDNHTGQCQSHIAPSEAQGDKRHTTASLDFLQNLQSALKPAAAPHQDTHSSEEPLVEDLSRFERPVWFQTQRYWHSIRDGDFHHVVSRAELKSLLSEDMNTFMAATIEQNSSTRRMQKGQTVITLRHLCDLAAFTGHIGVATNLYIWKTLHRDPTANDHNSLVTAYENSKIGAQSGRALRAILHPRLLELFTSGVTNKQRRSVDDAKKSIAEYCVKHLRSHRLDLATTVALAIPYDFWDQESRGNVVKSLFRLNLKAGQLKSCDHIIRWAGGSIERFEADAVRDYITACYKSKAYESLVRLLTDERYDNAANTTWMASQQNATTKTRAHMIYSLQKSSGHQPALFQAMLRGSSPEAAPKLAKRLQSLFATDLLAQWRATRHFDKVLRSYKSCVHLLSEILGLDMRASCQLLLAMTQICLAADQRQPLSSLLAELQRDVNDERDVFLVQMLSHVYDEQWHAVETLLQTGTTTEMNLARTSILHWLLEQYKERRHDSERLVEFALSLHNVLGVQPTYRLHMLIVQDTVAHERLDLLEQWLTVSSRRGWSFDLDANTVARALGAHVNARRPDTHTVMRAARQLSIEAPSLAGEALRDIVLACIAMDWKQTRWAPARRIAERQWAAMFSNSQSFPELGIYDRIRSVSEMDELRRHHPGLHRELLGGWPHANDRQDTDYDHEKLNKAKEELDTISMAQIDAITDQNMQPVADERHDVAFCPPKSTWLLLRSKMIIAMRRGQYNDVLSMYAKVCDDQGCPSTLLALNMAVHACLERSGDYEAADQLLARAERGGMNVALALRPMLKHQLDHISADNRGLDAMANKISEWYQICLESNQPAKPQLALAVAYRYVRCGRPSQAKAFLSKIPQTRWQDADKLDPAVMVEWIRIYGQLHSSLDVFRVIERAVETRTPVTRRMLLVVKQALRSPYSVAPRTMRPGSVQQLEFNQMAYKQLRRMFETQQADTAAFLPQLVTLLVRYHYGRLHRKPETSSPVDSVLGDDDKDTAVAAAAS